MGIPINPIEPSVSKCNFNSKSKFFILSPGMKIVIQVERLAKVFEFRGSNLNYSNLLVTSSFYDNYSLTVLVHQKEDDLNHSNLLSYYLYGVAVGDISENYSRLALGPRRNAELSQY
jgi:hypothetical protein